VLDEQSRAEMELLAAMGMPCSFGGARNSPAGKGGGKKPKPGKARQGGGGGSAAPHAVHLAGRAPPAGTHVRFDNDDDDGAASAGGDAPAADDGAACAPAGPPAGVPVKYWAQRYRYFSKFDAGACLDEEMWFSVTPEAVARHQAARGVAQAGALLVVDAFAGAGGNTVAFAAAGALALGVDVSRPRLLAARRNAELYGVAPRCDWVCGDWTALSAAMARARPGRPPPCAADLLFLSPPWGGPAYLDAPTFDLSAPLAGTADAAALLASAAALAPRVMFFLPRNVAADDVAALAAATAPGARAELEDVHLNGALKACTLYIGASFEEEPEETFGCAVCGIAHMSDTAQLAAHLGGKRHAAQLALQQADAAIAAPPPPPP
jgi:trimethylguanosine synthase